MADGVGVRIETLYGARGTSASGHKGFITMKPGMPGSVDIMEFQKSVEEPIQDAAAALMRQLELAQTERHPHPGSRELSADWDVPPTPMEDQWRVSKFTSDQSAAGKSAAAGANRWNYRVDITNTKEVRSLEGATYPLLLLLTRGSRAHEIAPKRAKYLRFPDRRLTKLGRGDGLRAGRRSDGYYRTPFPVHHPGYRGDDFVSEVIDRYGEDVAKVARQGAGKAVLRMIGAEG